MPIYKKEIPLGSGRFYLYEQHSEYRPGRSPRSVTRYIGPVNPKRRKRGLLAPIAEVFEWFAEQNKRTPDDIAADAMEKAQAQNDLREKLQQEINRQFYESMGVRAPQRNPVPIEKEGPPLLHVPAVAPPPENLPTGVEPPVDKEQEPASFEPPSHDSPSESLPASPEGGSESSSEP